ncbi:MAG: sigma-70 family RNA polymerase sigma factor [Actinobacteria bacterium]|nr:sigma-70 family RNA polymerase sigma factor [Actinomycetota bacterium]
MLTLEEIEICEKVGKYYASRWKLVERDDLVSHLVLWCAERDTTTLQRWRDEGSLGPKLYKSLKREAAHYCEKETTIKVGRDIHENNSYTLEIIKNTLPFVFSTPDVEDPINSRALLIIADVESALYGLPKDDIEIIVLRYQDEMTHDQIATYYSINTDNASQRLHRALERLLKALSGVALFDWSDVGNGGKDDD